MSAMERIVDSLRPLLRKHGARAAYVVGSWARGEAEASRDVDVVIVAPRERAEERPFLVRALAGTKLVYEG